MMDIEIEPQTTNCKLFIYLQIKIQKAKAQRYQDFQNFYIKMYLTPAKERFCDIERLRLYLETPLQGNQLEIIFEDQNNVLKYSQIPLNLVYNNCRQLNLKLKGFASDQDDFDQFVGYFLCFNNLISLKLRFYDKRIQYLDSLFNSISKIHEVDINLKNFKKIRLRNDFTKPMNGIKELFINLNGTSFKDQASRSIFEHFLQCQQLQVLGLAINKIDYLKYLLCVPKETQMKLDLYNSNVDLKFCDELIAFKKEQGLEKLSIMKNHIMIGVYLQSKQIQLENPYLQENNKQQAMVINEFTHQDFQLINKVPSFLQFFRNNNNQLIIRGSYDQFSLAASKILYPFEHLFPNICLQFNFQLYKKNNIWWFYYIDNYVYLKNKPLQNLINIKFSQQQILSVSQASWILDTINNNEYLMVYLYDRAIPSYFRVPGNKQVRSFVHNLLKQQHQLIEKKLNDKLRFFAFYKTIYSLIPLPQQVFYDLIDS